MPGITLESFVKGLTTDYMQIKNYNDYLLKALKGTKEIRVLQWNLKEDLKLKTGIST